METKSKIIVTILVMVLFVLCFFIFINKPKKYVKYQYREPQPNKTPIIKDLNVNYIVAPKPIVEPQETIIETITANECAERLYYALLGNGTDSGAICKVFDYIDTNEEFDEVMEAFNTKYNAGFDEYLAKEFFNKKMIAKKINSLLASRGIDRMINL